MCIGYVRVVKLRTREQIVEVRTPLGSHTSRASIVQDPSAGSPQVRTC